LSLYIAISMNDKGNILYPYLFLTSECIRLHQFVSNVQKNSKRPKMDHVFLLPYLMQKNLASMGGKVDEHYLNLNFYPWSLAQGLLIKPAPGGHLGDLQPRILGMAYLWVMSAPIRWLLIQQF
jgi:hypothetical protein